MTPHPEPIDTLAAYVDGALDVPIQAAIARHIEECPQCRADVDGQRQIKRFLAPGAPLAPPLPAGLPDRVRRGTFTLTPAAGRRRTWPRLGWPRPLLAAPAFALVLLLGVALGALWITLSSPSPAAAAAEMSLQDHMMAEHMGGVPGTPAGDIATVRASLAISLGMPLVAPADVPAGFHFMGGHALSLGSTQGAQLAWMADKTMLSFYQADDPGGNPPAGWPPVALDGRTYWVGTQIPLAVFWRHDGMIYLVVGNLRESTLLAVAQSVDSAPLPTPTR